MLYLEVSRWVLVIICFENVEGDLLPMYPVQIGTEHVGVNIRDWDYPASCLFPSVTAGRSEEGRVLDQQSLRNGEPGDKVWVVFVNDDGDFFGEVGDAGNLSIRYTEFLAR
jgi:hypothetical protein